MENQSQYLQNSSAMKMLTGTSAMKYSLKSLPRLRPIECIISVMSWTSSMVRTNGSIMLRFLNPISSLTFFMALSSHMNASR